MAFEEARYAGQAFVNDALKELLHDDGSRFVGCPDWPREDDPELFDAITCLREGVIRYRQEGLGMFQIGSSYIRLLLDWLWTDIGYTELVRFHFKQSPDMKSAFEVICSRIEAYKVRLPGQCT